MNISYEVYKKVKWLVILKSKSVWIMIDDK